MKILMKPIRMLLTTDEQGVLTPHRFQVKDDNKEYITIKVDDITDWFEEKLAGNRMLIYKCKSEFEGILRTFELKYEISTCKWFLYKM